MVTENVTPKGVLKQVGGDPCVADSQVTENVTPKGVLKPGLALAAAVPTAVVTENVTPKGVLKPAALWPVEVSRRTSRQRAS